MSSQPAAPRAPQSACCGSAAPSARPATTRPAAEGRSACCGDPTPNAETGACCSAPAATCGCRSGVAGADDPMPVEDEPPAARRLPVAVIGAGPIGLSAAVQLVQVRSVASALAGDEAGARDVELVLPETGVCQTELVGAGSTGAGACCR